MAPIPRKLLNASKLALINLLVFVILLSLTEIVLRRFFPARLGIIGHTQSPNSDLYGWGYLPGELISVLDPDTGHVYRSEANSRGWRDVEHQHENGSNAFRILVLGDSVTFGAIVSADRIFSRVLERLLKDCGLNVEVISIAYGGWGADQELEALLNDGIKYRPDLVIVQFSTNDLSENNYYMRALNDLHREHLGWKPFYYAHEDGNLVRNVNPHFKARKPLNVFNVEEMLNSGIASSEILKYVYVAYRNFKLHEDSIADGNQSIEIATQFTVTQNQLRMLTLNTNINPEGDFYRFLKRNIGRSITREDLLLHLEESEVRTASHVVLRILEKRWFHQYWSDASMHPKPEDGTSYEWQLYKLLIAQMKKICDEIGAKLVVFPETESGHFNWELAWYRTENSEANKSNYLNHLKTIQDLMSEIGVTVIQPRRIYGRARNDPHPNTDGNEAMALDIRDYSLETEIERMRARAN
jgi:GDSL-like Lipase/Acylhydrolase family